MKEQLKMGLKDRFLVAEVKRSIAANLDTPIDDLERHLCAMEDAPDAADKASVSEEVVPLVNLMTSGQVQDAGTGNLGQPQHIERSAKASNQLESHVDNMDIKLNELLDLVKELTYLSHRTPQQPKRNTSAGSSRQTSSNPGSRATTTAISSVTLKPQGQRTIEKGVCHGCGRQGCWI